MQSSAQKRSSYDVAIIGGGIMGSSAAYWLSRSKGVSVIVIERDASYATASSALSASAIRQQFSTPVCIEMSRFGMEFLKAIGAFLSVDEATPNVSLVERGYLYLADASSRQVLQENGDRQRAHGASVATLSPQSLKERFDWLETSDIALGNLGLAGEGWFDGYSLLQAFKAKARAQGVVYCTDEAVGLSLHGASVSDVHLASGERVSARAIVNAAGPQAARIAGWAGVAVPVVPEKRTVFVLDCRDPPSGCPLVIDPAGVWFRPEGRGFIAGGPADADDSRPGELIPDYAQFDALVWPLLARRVPAFETIRMQRAWAGHYEMNVFDHNALIGRLPGMDNLYVIAGFSGHGMQHAAAAGRGLSELILHGKYLALDLTPLSPDRLLTGQRLNERNII